MKNLFCFLMLLTALAVVSDATSCPDIGRTYAEDMTAWMCDFTQWKTDVAKWKLSLGQIYSVDTVEKSWRETYSCPDYSEVVCTDETFRYVETDPLNCTIIQCENAAFSDYQFIWEIWRQQLNSYRAIRDKINQLSPTKRNCPKLDNVYEQESSTPDEMTTLQTYAPTTLQTSESTTSKTFTSAPPQKQPTSSITQSTTQQTVIQATMSQSTTPSRTPEQETSQASELSTLQTSGPSTLQASGLSTPQTSGPSTPQTSILATLKTSEQTTPEIFNQTTTSISGAPQTPGPTTPQTSKPTATSSSTPQTSTNATSTGLQTSSSATTTASTTTALPPPQPTTTVATTTVATTTTPQTTTTSSTTTTTTRSTTTTRATSSYSVYVKTGAYEGAETDAGIYLEIFGTHGQTPARLLDNGSNNFERNQLDAFFYNDKYVGKVNKIRIRNDNTKPSIFNHDPGWYLEYVTVNVFEDASSTKFECHGWMSYESGLTKLLPLGSRCAFS